MGTKVSFRVASAVLEEYMIWVVGLAVLLVVAGGLVLSRPIRIPREPEREGLQDAEASSAYDQISYWPIYAFERYIMVKAFAKESPGHTLLDIGSGPGHLTAELSRTFPSVTCVGLDINDDMLAIARRRFQGVAGLEFVRGDAEQLPLADNSVDAIVSSLSVHHWGGAETALQEVRRVLAPGGVVLLFDLRRDCPRWMYYVFIVGQVLFLPAAIRRTNGAVGSIWASFTAAELEMMLARAGFQNPSVERRFGWLLARGGKGPV